jgi:hypothetical protein
MGSQSRTTVRLNDQLLRDTKKLAAETGRTLTAVIEDALRVALARKESSKSDSRWEFPTFGMGGLMPGVDLDNNAALLDLMEADDDSL